MLYSDINQLTELIGEHKDYQEMVNKMAEEVNDFCEDFTDDPSHVSRWGHHYFCKEDGGLLIFDRHKPHEHKCSNCGKVYSNELLDGVWMYMYRNEAILTAWKSALLYKVTNDSKYLNHVRMIIGYYAENYLSFELHNKEGNSYESLETMAWGCGRLMPQGLNESIVIIRMINALELVKNDVGTELLTSVETMFTHVFAMIKPQVVQIHNINCWYNSVIGTMGLFLENKEMIEFAFEGEFNIRRQLREGVTKDGFWYEGSILYNFFTLEGIMNLMLFAKVYDYTFGEEEEIPRKMLNAAYLYAFDSHQLPNPNDGWPNINLKTYTYVYSIGAKIFGIDSDVGNLLKNILSKSGERGVVPLSKPYYFENRISMEQLCLVPEVIDKEASMIEAKSTVFKSSYNGILKNKETGVNVFHKFGHNGPSHAHPDKMTVEVVIGDECLSRDLSNSGYGNRFCNEWHRVSLSHNTVVVDGKDHTSTGPGECIEFSEHAMKTRAFDVYDGVQFMRDIQLTKEGYKDVFCVESEEKHHYDYLFHVEGRLLSELEYETAELKYNENGYQHIHDIKRVITESDFIVLTWELGEIKLCSEINLSDKELYLASTPDNPVTNKRQTMILSTDSKVADFDLKWKIMEV